MAINTLEWNDTGLKLIDQTLLPVEYRHVVCTDVEEVWDAIKRLVVRGAPAIGVAAGYGVVIGIRNSTAATYDAFMAELEQVCDYLASSRPTCAF